MPEVFVVQHAYEVDGVDDVKLIGVYSTKEAAERAVERLLVQPGFRDHPGGFHVDRYPVDKDHWTEGFVTIKQSV